MLGGEQPPSAPESSCDFIDDQKQAVRIANAAQTHQQLGIMETHPTRALHHGFHDHGGVGVFDQRIELCEIVGARGGAGAAIRRPRRERVLREDPRPNRMHARIWVTHAHRGERVPVIATAPGDKSGTLHLSQPTLVLDGHFHRDFHGN